MALTTGSTALLFRNELREVPAIITPSDENAEYPATNLVLNNCCLTFRSNAADATPVRLVIDFGSAQTINAVAFANVNFQVTATVTIEGHTSNSWGSPAFSVTMDLSDYLQDPNNLLESFSTNKTYRYWRVSITDDGNPDGFIEIGELFFGTATELTDAHDSLIPLVFGNNNVELRTEFGQAYVYERNKQRRWDLAFTNIQANTKDQLKSFFSTINTNAKPFFLRMSGDDTDKVYFCRMISELEIQRISYDIYTARLKFQEEPTGLTLPRG